MKSAEIKNELKMNYDELVYYLLKKYGAAKYDYFCNVKCRSRNPKNSRTSEGLYLHHIDEDKAFQLSVDKLAGIQPYRYQKADRLVYCNVLEHLILHIKIIEESLKKEIDNRQMNGIGGAVSFIYPQINDYYNGYEFHQQYIKNIFNNIKENYDDYINILRYFLNIVKDDSFYSILITKRNLSIGYDGQVIDKIYKNL